MPPKVRNIKEVISRETLYFSPQFPEGDVYKRQIQKICKRDPFSGRTVTGGIVTVKDSSWLLSWTLNRQQQFRDQPRNQLCVWVYGLFSDKPGDYVRKPMRDCTGREICMEWLYHLGVPVEDIASMAENSANTCLLYTSGRSVPTQRPRAAGASCSPAKRGSSASTPGSASWTRACRQ